MASNVATPPAVSSEVEHRQNRPEVPSFDSGDRGPALGTLLHRKWEIRLAEDHLCETGVYLRRWRIETPWFSVRLHHWLHSDDNRAPHDHPWSFITFVLRGQYMDESPSGQQRVRAGRAYFRTAEHAHWVHLDSGPVWTLVLTGSKVRRWGFWETPTKWVKSFKWFHHRGNHPCD